MSLNRRLNTHTVADSKLLVTGNALPSSLIVFNLMMEATHPFETSVVTRAIKRRIPEGFEVLAIKIRVGAICTIPFRTEKSLG